MNNDFPTWLRTSLVTFAVIGFAAAVLGLLLPGLAGTVAALVAVLTIMASPIARLVLVLLFWQPTVDFPYFIAAAAVTVLIALAAAIN